MGNDLGLLLITGVTISVPAQWIISSILSSYYREFLCRRGLKTKICCIIYVFNRLTVLSCNSKYFVPLHIYIFYYYLFFCCAAYYISFQWFTYVQHFAFTWCLYFRNVANGCIETNRWTAVASNPTLMRKTPSNNSSQNSVSRLFNYNTNLSSSPLRRYSGNLPIRSSANQVGGALLTKDGAQYVGLYTRW